MEDEEGYAVLNRQPKQRQPGRPSGAGAQGSPPCPRWHPIAVGVGWAGNIVLTVVVIALGIWVFQLHGSCEGQTRGALKTLERNETRIVSSTEGSSSLEDFRSHLKRILCEPHNSSLAEGSGCKLCPRDWLLHGDKCYWLSKERKDWTRSRDDCSRKGSRLLVIQNQEEMNFTQAVIRDASYVWIGFNVPAPGGTWKWVDGSPLDQACFPVSGSAAGNSCGRLKGPQIQSESCGSYLQWICQKEAAVI